MKDITILSLIRSISMKNKHERHIHKMTLDLHGKPDEKKTTVIVNSWYKGSLSKRTYKLRHTTLEKDTKESQN